MNEKTTPNRTITKTTPTHAADAYQARSNDIARLIDLLQMELESTRRWPRPMPRTGAGRETSDRSARS